MGAVSSNNVLKPTQGSSADGIVCGISMLFAAPLIYTALICVESNMLAAWLLIFFGIAALCCCWVLIAEITMNVIVANRRATAQAFQSTVSHLLGDAASPYLTGSVSSFDM